jgi:hypothetical protein
VPGGLNAAGQHTQAAAAAERRLTRAIEDKRQAVLGVLSSLE